MKLYFISDLHLGLRFPYTTKDTSHRFRDKQIKAAMSLFQLPGSKICMGDLFNSFSASVPTLVDAIGVLSGSGHAYLMAGNHDKSKNSDDKSALDYLEVLDLKGVTQFVIDHPRVVTIPLKDNRLLEVVMIPHQHTQELFDQRIAEAIASPAKGRIRFLVLHCNYGDFPGKTAENYLTNKQLESLSVFDRIISGHQHEASQHRNLIYPGSAIPCNFGEFGRRFLLSFDTATESFEEVEYVDVPGYPSFGYSSVDFDTYMNRGYFDLDSDFVEVTGLVSPSNNVVLTKKIMDDLRNSPKMVAVKPNVEVVTTTSTGEVVEQAQVDSWLDTVMSRLNPEGQTYLSNFLD